jgi:hypothetical protein
LPSGAMPAEAVAERVGPGKTTIAQASAVLKQLEAYARRMATRRMRRPLRPDRGASRGARGGTERRGAVVVGGRCADTEADSFAKRVLAARAHTGEVIRCSPKGDNGTLMSLKRRRSSSPA